MQLFFHKKPILVFLKFFCKMILRVNFYFLYCIGSLNINARIGKDAFWNSVSKLEKVNEL